VAAYDNGGGVAVVAAQAGVGGRPALATGAVAGPIASAVYGALNTTGITTGADIATIAAIPNNANFGAIIGQGDGAMQAAIQAGVDAADA